MIRQTENQLQYTTSVQQIEFIRSSAISQINAIIEQAKQKPDEQTSVKDESVVSADSFAIREDLPLLLAK